MKTNLLKVLVMTATLFSVGCSNVNSKNGEILGIEIKATDNIQELQVGETLSLEAIVYPKNALADVSWSSSDTNIATVNEEGVVLGLSEGKVQITCTSNKNENVKQEIKLLITPKPYVEIMPESIELKAKDNITTLTEGDKLELEWKVLPVDAINSVSWSSSDTNIATVKNGVVNAISEGSVRITITSRVKQDVSDYIDLTINAKPTQDWDNINHMTYEEFIEIEEEEKVKIKGVVAHVTNEDEGKVNVYILNENKGYYIYGLVNKYNLEIGSSYEIGGYKKVYRGLNEIVDVEICNKLDENISYTVNDISNLNVKDYDTMLPYQNSYIKADATITKMPSKTTSSFSIGLTINGNTIDLRVDPSIVGQEDFTEIVNKITTASLNDPLSFKAIMSSYGYSNSYFFNQITALKAEDLEFKEASDDVIVEKSLGKLSIPAIIDLDTNFITLPNKIDNIDVSWTSSNTAIIAHDGSVTHPELDTNVTLTAELSLNNVVKTKNFTTLVYGSKSTYTSIATLDFEDSLPASNYGTSDSTPKGYEGGDITSNGRKWKLENALIGAAENDKRNGTFSLRAKSGDSKTNTGRVSLSEDLEINAIEFQASRYGNDDEIKVSVEYSIDSGQTWKSTFVELSITNTSLETFRILLPETSDRVAIYVVENSGNRVNIDDINLLK